MFAFTANSESEGEDGYDLSTQFDEVPMTELENDDEDPVNINLELAIEVSLCKPTPHGETESQREVCWISNKEN